MFILFQWISDSTLWKQMTGTLHFLFQFKKFTYLIQRERFFLVLINPVVFKPYNTDALQNA